MKPSNFCALPFGSVLQNTEAEIVALNIMKILKRTGDVWRVLSWREYKAERLTDCLTDKRGFSDSELGYFNQVAMYTTSEQRASQFSPDWSVVVSS